MKAKTKKRAAKPAAATPPPAPVAEPTVMEQLLTKPAKEPKVSTAEWARQNGYDTVWKSVPKEARKQFASARALLARSEGVKPKIQALEAKLQALKAVDAKRDAALATVAQFKKTCEEWKGTYLKFGLGGAPAFAAPASV